MSMFKIAADIKTADQLHLPRPEAVYHTEVSQPTAIQKEMVQMLSERAAKVHSGTVDPSNDNMLKITSDGRKLGLDQRIINPDLPDDPSSKVNRCVDNIFRIWQDGQADKLTQLVFCDLSTPKIAAAKRAEKPAGGALDNPELHALETQLASDGITSDVPFPSMTIFAASWSRWGFHANRLHTSMRQTPKSAKRAVCKGALRAGARPDGQHL